MRHNRRSLLVYAVLRFFMFWALTAVAVLATIDAWNIADVEIGSRVVFDATLESSDDDESFAFFKRPAKARIVGE